jgi:hypothetical protein
MTEQEWLQATDPGPMLSFLKGRVSKRKQRLFAVACCRHFWTDMTQTDQQVVEVAELFADGRVDEQQLVVARQNAAVPIDLFDLIDEGDELPLAVATEQVQRDNTRKAFAGLHALMAAVRLRPDLRIDEITYPLLKAAYWSGPGGYETACINARYAAREAERAKQMMTIRCMFGNPCRPVSIDSAWLVWNDKTVTRIAELIYEERAFDRLPILADALEESGCTDAAILNHCRQQGVHTRGCWAVDLLLNKS